MLFPTTLRQTLKGLLTYWKLNLIKKIIYLNFIISSILAFSQVEDTYLLVQPKNQNSTAIGLQKPKHTYTKLINRTSYIPGVGQIINKKYYKAPLFASAMYLTTHQALSYQKLKSDLLVHNNNILDNDPSTNNTSNINDAFMPSELTRLSNNRNFYLILSGLIWGLSIADAKVDAQIKLFPHKNHKPYKAALYSAVLPGLGQLYNRKFWKVPILFGGAGFMYYYFNLNNEQYQAFNTTYILKLNEPEQYESTRRKLEFNQSVSDEELKNYRNYYVYDTDENPYSIASTSRLESLKEKYRKRRELAVIYSFLLYAGNIIDATVDSHLENFNINESIDIAFIPIQIDRKIGLGLNIHFALGK